MNKRAVIHPGDATMGVLHGGAGTFRVLLDFESVGARHLSLLLNTMKAGATGSEHRHSESEHCWYVLSGTGTIYIESQPYRISPGVAAFVPQDTLHRIDVDPGEDLTYILVYAPPGPEQLLKSRGIQAFDEGLG
jgi:quercetin dioxygenase-like cupin family protein